MFDEITDAIPLSEDTTDWRKIVVIVSFLMLSTQNYAQCYEEDFNALCHSYDVLMTDFSAENQRLYFNAFPDNWDEFILTERMLECNPSKGCNIDDYIAALFRLPAVDDTLFCIKMINISIGGRLDADGPNMFLHALHGRMGCTVCNPFSPKSGNREQSWDLMLRLLSDISECDRLRFWQYYWSSLYHEEDGGHKDDRHRPEMEWLKRRYRKQYPELMAQSVFAYKHFAGGITFSGGYDPSYWGIR